MTTAQLASDPALNVTTLEATDLLVGLRAVTGQGGNITGYQPFNITVENFASAIVGLGLQLIAPNLETTAPANGGIFLDAGAFSYSAVTGIESGQVLTVAAALKTYAALAASLPTSDPGTGSGTYWNNEGVITESVAP